MINGYYSATGGMITQFNRLDVISNNLANLNTNAFKRDDVIVSDFLRLYKQTQDTLPLQEQTRAAAKYQNRNLNRVPLINEEYTDFSSGALMHTENPLDFALQKSNAYFVIQTPDGIRYTRDGGFVLDSDGYLSTKQGFRVLSRAGIDTQGGIIIGQGMFIEVDTNGNLALRPSANGEQNAPAEAGSLAIVSFDNPRYLQKVGDNLYSYPESRLQDREIALEGGLVMQGFIEKSNVNAIREMTALIETNRLVDMYSKAMRTFVDDFAPEAIGKLAAKA